ncbi:MAG: AbrB/MazE/SpoVT family DNA-binding domain-containing protein [Armatimonadetes bacterium]|nr:AbrB/MazE/SpoVT family DNA-binding domain-containing protein [Armatimonadota bacterium]
MVTTVTKNSMVTVPAELARHMGIKPGSRLEGLPVEDTNQVLVTVLPDRGALARQLYGAGRAYSPERDAVAEFIAERRVDG